MTFRLIPLALTWLVTCVTTVPGQDAPDQSIAESGAAATPEAPAEEVTDVLGRRVLDGEPTVLAFRNVTVEELIPFIVESTGKVVMPQEEILSRRVTIVNDRPIPRNEALDLVFLALQQATVAVVETQKVITLRDLSELSRQDVPVIGPEQSVLDRRDRGTIAEKVFPLLNNTADSMENVLEDILPEYATLTIDEESNQIAVMGNIGLLQRIERLVNALDRPKSDAPQTETFRLRFADAELIKENIEELYAEDSSSSRQGQSGQQGRFQQFRMMIEGRGRDQDEQAVAPSANLRVTANTQQNSVTVMAEPGLLARIRDHIENDWDLPLSDEQVIPRIYDLENTDPIKVRDLLEGLFGQGSTTTSAGGQGASRQVAGQSQGVGRLAGQFSFEAIPEAGRLVVVAKSPDNLAVIDKIIDDLDRPQTAGLPAIVELKHASAEELAEQLNTLLAQEGTLAQIPRIETGLSAESSTASPFAQDDQTQQQDAQTSAGMMSFWWQRARPPTDARSASNLIGQLRIVPVWRQNAVMVISPPEYRSSIVSLIESLDQPGRQVLISAIVAEISRDDATILGLRWSSLNIDPSNPENVLGLNLGATGTENDFATSLFDTSVLDASMNLNVLLQALSQKTAINILSEPRIFTSDNQEAEFFDGQDIPFVTDSQTTDTGSTIQGFDYRAVGIQLRARPRITPNNQVDLRVNLELSSIMPGETLFGGFIVDRRETTTQLIVASGQTVVISGILRSEESDIVRKVPLLGDLPLIGLLFRSIDKGRSETELVVFITPFVVENDVALKELNQPYRERLNELREQLGRPTKAEGSPEQPPDESLQEAPDQMPDEDADDTAPAQSPDQPPD